MQRVMKTAGILASLLMLVLPLSALGAPVGKITHVEGRVDVTAGDKTRPANPGDPVDIGDILRAKSKARAEVTFLDGNIIRLAENTRIRITGYQAGEGKTSTLELFRGKAQNIVSALAKNARYEVHTPTAVCGVRGTDFFAFFLDGVSGFIPKEGILYGYSRSMPQEVKIVTVGQAILVPAANRPAVIQPANVGEVEKHLQDTVPTGRGKRGARSEKEGGAAAEAMNKITSLSGIPASWASAAGDLLAGETGIGKLQGYISSLNNPAAGMFTTDGTLTRTSILSLVDLGSQTWDYPVQGFSHREYPLQGGGSAGEYLNFTLSAPVNGVSTITAAGAQAMWGETSLAGPQSYTVVAGGAVNGLFDPATTTLTWADFPQGQGSFLETNTFLNQQTFMTDNDRKNFEQTNRIPAFDVGMANLSGSNGALTVNMNNIKFFRFQDEADPRIWATNSVTGSYTANPAIGAQVTLNSSNGLTGLTHTFEVKQWDTGNRIWGASIYRGAGDTGGTLSRSAADTARAATGNLPAGASPAISITELRGGASGAIIPNPYPFSPGMGSFTGTAAGTVKTVK